MFDCGPATTYKMAQTGLHPLDIDYLFFTHHHFDHDVDYPCFMMTRWDESIGKENLVERRVATDQPNGSDLYADEITPTH